MEHPSLRFVRGPVVALLVLVATTPVGAEDVSSRDRFQLWYACEPIYLVVESLPDHAAEMGLTREAITTTVRSRLRAARLYSRSPNRSVPYRRGSRIYVTAPRPWLYVYVNTLSEGRAFDVDLGFIKELSDPELNGETGRATTWDTGTVGQGDAAYILSVVSQLTDKFIDEYLRVNDSACQGPD